MKKLFILTPAILLTAAIYAADTSSITVLLFNGDMSYNFSLDENDDSMDEYEGLRGNKKLQINHINLKTETFKNLAEKVYNKIYNSNELNGTSFYSRQLKKYLPIKRANLEIEKFEGYLVRNAHGDTYELVPFEYSPHDSSTTLDKAGIDNGEEIFTYLVETKPGSK